MLLFLRILVLIIMNNLVINFIRMIKMIIKPKRMKFFRKILFQFFLPHNFVSLTLFNTLSIAYIVWTKNFVCDIAKQKVYCNLIYETFSILNSKISNYWFSGCKTNSNFKYTVIWFVIEHRHIKKYQNSDTPTCKYGRAFIMKTFSKCLSALWNEWYLECE